MECQNGRFCASAQEVLVLQGCAASKIDLPQPIKRRALRAGATSARAIWEASALAKEFRHSGGL